MRQPWQVFAIVLSGALLLGLVVTVVTVGFDLAALGADTGSGAGLQELAQWRDGVRTGRSGAASGSTVSMVLFALIPIVTYVVTLTNYLRHRRWAYVTMAVMQLVILFLVAVPVLLHLGG